jgi:hypothetical protein
MTGDIFSRVLKGTFLKSFDSPKPLVRSDTITRPFGQVQPSPARGPLPAKLQREPGQLRSGFLLYRVKDSAGWSVFPLSGFGVPFPLGPAAGFSNRRRFCFALPMAGALRGFYSL